MKFLFFGLFTLLLSCSHLPKSVSLHVEQIELNLERLDSELVTAYEAKKLRTLEVVGIPKSATDPYELQGLIFFPYEYPLPSSKKRYQALTLGLELKERRIFPREFFLQANFEHPRQANFVDLDSDGRVDLIVSDHGHDEEPFAGAYTQFFFQNQKNQFEMANYQTRLGYWFSSCSVNIDRKRSLTLLISTGTEAGDFPTGPKLLEVTSGREFRVHGLPPNIANTRVRKYLSCAFSPERPFELYLGVMDGEVHSGAPLDYRFALNISGSDFQIESNSLPMPAKKGASDRGTIELKAIDIDGDSLSDLASNSHDHQFSRGLVELFRGREAGALRPWQVFNPSDSPVPVARDYFIPRFHLVDLDHNGLLDVIYFTGQSGSEFDSKAKSSVHLHLQQAGGTFIDVSDQIPNNKDLQGLTPVTLEDGTKGLLYILGPRRYELFRFSVM